MKSSKGQRDHPYTAASPTRRPDRPGMNAFTTPSTEPPPAYSATPPLNAPIANLAAPANNARPSSSYSNASRISATSTPDDPYAFLNTFDTVFLIDDSGSMAGRSWRECSSALEAITPICTAHDKDGIDIYFLNAPESRYHKQVKDASTVHEIFSTVRPSGGTPTGQRLNRIIKDYLRELRAAGSDPGSVKPVNIIVITDGVPSDDVEMVLVNAAKALDRLDADPWQMGVQFVQVGEEQGAKEHLEGLDDDLSAMGGGCRDIVDTVPFNRGRTLSGEMILKVVLGAVNKRLDRRQV